MQDTELERLKAKKLQQLEQRLSQPGRRVVVCMGCCCPSNNSGAVYRRFVELIGSQGLNVKVSTSGCMGPCQMGPNLVVFPEGVLYSTVRPADVDEIVREHLINGRQVTRLQPYRRPQRVSQLPMVT